jgi:hypothetical protein
MNRIRHGTACKSQEDFRLRFQQLLSEYSDHRRSAAEGFGPAWEQALEEVPLSDSEQGVVYRELIAWAKVIHSRRTSTGGFDNGR